MSTRGVTLTLRIHGGEQAIDEADIEAINSVGLGGSDSLTAPLKALRESDDSGREDAKEALRLALHLGECVFIFLQAP